MKRRSNFKEPSDEVINYIGDMIFYSRFTDTDGITDQTGNNTITVLGAVPSYNTGIFSATANHSIKFDNDISAVTISDNDLMSIFQNGTDKPYSIFFNIYFYSIIQDRRFFTKRGNGSSPTVDFEIDVFATSGSRIGIIINDTINAKTVSGVAEYTLLANTPYSIILCYNGKGTSRGFEVYVNGVRQVLTRGINDNGYKHSSNLNSRTTIMGNNWSATATDSSTAPNAKVSGFGVCRKFLNKLEIAEIDGVHRAGNFIM